MLRKLLATGIVFAAGYIIGVVFGFRAAVVDYVENDAEVIEERAEDLYPSPEEGAASGDQNIPSIVEEAIEESNERTRRRGNSADGGSKGFQ